MNDYIHIKGARVNNLKNIDLDIPRNKLIVITGLSGSGKSSLAFDTLYAEGQRRYVESLSAYARQFLGRMSKPECDYIKGIPPAIAIEQKVSSRNPRSTVGTSTEIYEYLRLLYARIGRTFSPVSGQEVKKNTTEDVVQCMLSYSKGTRFTVLAPLQVREGRTLQEQLDSDFKQGFSRIEVDGEVVRIEDFMLELASDPSKGEDRTIHLLIDRMSCDDSKDAISRLTDSAETAFYEGNGQCMLRIVPSGILHTFSTRFEADGITFEEPSDNLFAFNSPVGACPVCEGFGRVIGIDEKLVIPNSALSVYDGAVVCWRGEKMGEWKTEFCRRAQKADFPIFEPYYKHASVYRKLIREECIYIEIGKVLIRHYIKALAALNARELLYCPVIIPASEKLVAGQSADKTYFRRVKKFSFFVCYSGADADIDKCCTVVHFSGNIGVQSVYTLDYYDCISVTAYLVSLLP